ncbi:MAG: amidohydrolase family protein, partial [Pelagibacterales bacterium]|nr:amidohydrolase family protein [Pelagibacterales bacterium]
MKKKYFLNANIIDPQNSIEEIGGLIVGENGKIEAVGKKVNTNNIPSREKYIDLKEKYIIPGIVDMRVFVGEPGFEYKENFRTLSEAALSGGVTSVVTMPNTDPVIDNVSIVDFLKRRGRDKAKINIFPTASLTKNLEGTNMTEFGLLQERGIIAFTDGYKTIQNTRLMSRIMRSAYDLNCLVMQHVEDSELAKDGMVNDGIISTKLGLQGISELAEKIIIERDLTLLEDFNCRYHISQISSQKSLDVIKKRKEDVNFTCGVSINNLSLNENDIGDFRTFLKLSP